MINYKFMDKIFYGLSIISGIIAFIYTNIDFLLVSIIFIIASIIVSGKHCDIDEQDYIWRMNNGPSVGNRGILFKDQGTGKSEFVVWVGGADGYYKSADNRKFDYSLSEIKN